MKVADNVIGVVLTHQRSASCAALDTRLRRLELGNRDSGLLLPPTSEDAPVAGLPGYHVLKAEEYRPGGRVGSHEGIQNVSDRRNAEVIEPLPVGGVELVTLELAQAVRS